MGHLPKRTPLLGFTKGRYAVRLAQNSADVDAAQRLRYRGFSSSNCDQDELRDHDEFDAMCQHVLIEDLNSGTLVCTFRFQDFENGHAIAQSYSAQFYGLDALSECAGRMMEIGRFCIHPDWNDPDILRLALGALTQYVDASDVQILFGCSSFQGTQWRDHGDALAMLKHRHLGPKRLLPHVKSPDVFKFAARLRRKPNAKRAALKMPPLLKTYLMMGGWVSDHAVVDAQLDTMHVFTSVDINAIPPARKKLLRAVAM